AQKSLGPIAGRINLAGIGESFRELMATASGDTFVVMSGGEVSGLLVELAGLDVAETLGVLVRGDTPSPSAVRWWTCTDKTDRWAYKLWCSIPPIRSFLARGSSTSATNSSTLS